METDERLMVTRLTRDIAKYFVSEGEQLLKNDNVPAVERAYQYFTWAKKLYLHAESARKGGLTDDVWKKLDERIVEAEQKLQQLKNSTSMSQEN